MIRQALAVTAMLGTCVTFSLPAHAEYSVFNGQPIAGPLHIKEAQLQQQLNNDYQLGLIDPYELANMGRDLDGIRVKEEAYRMRTRGLTSGGYNRIALKLAQFQGRLNHHCADKVTSVVVVPVVPVR